MKQKNKIISLSKAVSTYIKDGSHISFGGFTVNRQPMACVYEIIRQQISGLHVYMHSGGQGFDILVGAGCVDSVELAYGANGRFAPTCFQFRKAAQQGLLAVEDYSNYQMALRFKAGAMGVPFLPIKSSMGTDIINRWGFDSKMRQNNKRLPNHKLLVIENEFSDRKSDPVVLVPAINPDVTVLHVQQADTQGTIRIAGLTFADIDQAQASRHTIVTCEELVEPEVLRKEPDHNHLPFFIVDAVIPIPKGAHPCACYGYYDYDIEHLEIYKQYSSDDANFQHYLEKFVFGVNNFEEYLTIIGEKTLKKLRATPPFGYAAGLKRG